MVDFTDKIVVITGGAGALGSTVAKMFNNAGATVIIIDIREDGINSVVDEIGGGTAGYVCDLTSEEEVKTTVSKIIEKFGRIDILSNIAGGFTMGGKTHETDLSTVEKMLDFNFKTMYILSKHVLKHMVTKDAGTIVNIGARSGLEGSAEMGPYVGSKAMVIRATETMAREYKDHGIRVNCILPGTIDTAQNRKDMPDANFDKWVLPEHLGNVIMFLASDEAIAVNGASVPVYGGTL